MPGIEQRKKLLFYQDVPYSAEFPTHTEEIVSAFADAGARLQASRQDVGAVFQEKLRLVSIYASQFKLELIAPGVEDAASHAGPEREGRHELCFEVGELPRRARPFGAYSGRARVERLLKPLAAWRHRHRGASRVRVLSIEPIARWEDVSVLLDAFPLATVELHAPAVYAKHETRPIARGLVFRPLSGTRAAWLARLARLAVARPLTTLILPGEGWDAWLPIARAAFFLSDPFFSVRMNDLALALNVLGRDADGSASATTPGP
jgi:hypothetical protein